MLEEMLYATILLFCGLLVLCHFMGNVLFACGMIRLKSVNTIILQNLSAFSLVIIFHLLIGYDIMHGDPSKLSSLAVYLGKLFQLAPIYPQHSQETVLAIRFFHSLLPCISIAIIASMTAERLRLIPFLIFSVVLTAVIFPIAAYWVWGRSGLMQFGFTDESGTSLVYLIGSIAGLTGTLILGPRSSRQASPILEGSNIPLASQGMFLILLGCIGLNTGSFLLLHRALTLPNISLIFINNCLAFSSGIFISLILTRVFYRSSDLTLIFNGAIAGLVAIASMPLYESAMPAIFIGALSGGFAFLTILLFNRLSIEDPTGAFGSFGVASIIGLIAIPTARPFWHQCLIQLLGTAAIAIWAGVASFVTWYVIRMLLGLGYSKTSQQHGLDILECGMHAYPQFQTKHTE